MTIYLRSPTRRTMAANIDHRLQLKERDNMLPFMSSI